MELGQDVVAQLESALLLVRRPLVRSLLVGSVSVLCVSLETRPRDSIVADEDVKKQTTTTTTKNEGDTGH